MRRILQEFTNHRFFDNKSLLVAILVIFLCSKAYAQVEYILDETCVSMSDGYITSCDCVNDDYIKLVIPETINGQAVKGIADNLLGNYSIFYSLTNIADIEFPNTMEYIGDNVGIHLNSYVAAISFPDSLKYIGSNSFSTSSLIDSLIFPEKLEYIGTGAFKDCNVSKIDIPKSVNYIGSAAFNTNIISIVNGKGSNGIIYARNTDGTINYQKIVSYGGSNKNIDFIPDSVTSLSSSSFDHCYLESIVLPDSLKAIGSYAFRTNFLLSVNIPSSVDSIGDFCFMSNSLESVFIPDTLYYLGVAAFNRNRIQAVNGQQSNGLFYARDSFGLELSTAIVSYGGNSDTIGFIPSTVTHINEFSFDYQNLNSITLPSGLKSIGNYSLRGNNLDTISLPESVSYIGKQALYNNSLTTINLPESLLSLEEFSLASNSIDTVILPKSVTYIGMFALNGNSFSKFILPVSETHELLYWINNDSVKYNGEDTISIMNKTYSAVLGGSLINPCDLSYGTLNETSCDIFISPSNKYIWTQTGIYTDTIPNSLGCDSVITIDLAINNSSTSSITETVCDSYSSPSGKVWTVSDVYLDTIPNAVGCDSLITIDLIVNNSSTSHITETACNSYTSPSGMVWTVSDTYTDTIPNALGCDSVITIDLAINNSSTSSITEIVCDSYTSPSGKVWTATDVYLDTIPNAAGCDSIITIDLTIYCVTSISNNSILSVSVYPNPFNDFVIIELDEICDNLLLQIFDMSGQLIATKSFKKIKQFTYSVEGKSGGYILKLHDGKGKVRVVELIKE